MLRIALNRVVPLILRLNEGSIIFKSGLNNTTQVKSTKVIKTVCNIMVISTQTI